MRILANFGHRTNGDSYSVTFETTGDVPISKAPETVDNLFRLAKEAIKRQVTKNMHSKEGNNHTKSGNSTVQDSNVTNGKITQKQMKFIYDLLKERKGLSGNNATSQLKNEFSVQYVRDISFEQADGYIKTLLNEAA